MAKQDADILDDDLLDVFYALLDANGIVATMTDDGVLLGFTVDRLKDLLSAARRDEDGQVIIFVSKDQAIVTNDEDLLN